MKSSKSSFASICLHILGVLFCFIPPAVCTLSFFPLFEEGGSEKRLAGLCALLLVICAIPLLRALKKRLTDIPSYFMWLSIFLLFLLLSRICEQMIIISLVGFISNLIGAFILSMSERRKG